MISLLKALWDLVKRPDSALLLLSAVCLFGLEAFWHFHGLLWSMEAKVLLAFCVVFFALATFVSLKRKADTTSWKSFLGMAVLALAALVLWGEYWTFYAFPVLCAVVSAILAARQGSSA
jgi:hypothetical protein